MTAQGSPRGGADCITDPPPPHTHTHTTSLKQLTWHDGAIPDSEVWVKVGDKGGGTFKMNFQIVNVPHPNSVHNTCVFAVFEASDSVSNLHVTLDRYKGKFKDLQKTKWRLE